MLPQTLSFSEKNKIEPSMIPWVSKELEIEKDNSISAKKYQIWLCPSPCTPNMEIIPKQPFFPDE